MPSLSSQIESVLFVRTEGTKISFLETFLGVSKNEIEGALTELTHDLTGRGVTLLRSGDTVMLTTIPEMSDKITSLFEEDTGGELTPASLQTLSIILYKKVATRGEISYIRGVDSRMSLRNLSLRGLIEKAGSDSYRATPECLRFLGVAHNEDLPRFKDINQSFTHEISSRKGE